MLNLVNNQRNNNPRISVTNPPINEKIISWPIPFPLANRTNIAVVNVGPKKYTKAMLTINIIIQFISKTRAKGMIGRINPLIHGIEEKIE